MIPFLALSLEIDNGVVGYLRFLLRRRRGLLLPVRSGDLLPRDHDRDDADDLRSDGKRLPAPDGGVPLPVGGRCPETRVPARRSQSASGRPRVTPPSSLIVTTVGAGPRASSNPTARTCGWPISTANTVSRVRASDGRLLETWTGAVSAQGVLVALGRVFAVGTLSPGRLYMIDPAQPAGVVTTVASNLGPVLPPASRSMAAGSGPQTRVFRQGTVSIVTPGAAPPWTVTTVTARLRSPLYGAVYDGSNMWVTDSGSPGSLLKLSTSGAILQTVAVGTDAFRSRSLTDTTSGSPTSAPPRCRSSGHPMGSFSGP